MISFKQFLIESKNLEQYTKTDQFGAYKGAIEDDMVEELKQNGIMVEYIK